jgi:hypothetical protein
MKACLTLAASALLAGTCVASEPPPQVQFSMRIYEAGTNGSQDSDTYKIVAQPPAVVTLEGRKTTLVAGGERAVKGMDGHVRFQAVGPYLEVTPTYVRDGTAWLKFVLDNATSNQSARTTWVGEYRFGEPTRIPFPVRSGETSLWAEIVVER